MKSWKPTATDVQKMFEEAEVDFSEAYTLFDEDERYYELDFAKDLDLPKEQKEKGVVLPTARANVDTFADYIDITNAKVQVSRRKNTDTENESAAQLTKFGSGLIYMTNVQSTISPWRQAAKHYPLYGVCWFKTVFSADRWPDKPERKKRESEEAYKSRLDEWEGLCAGRLPILIQAVNPTAIYFDTATMGDTWVMEHYEKRITDIIRRYPDWSNPKGKDANAPTKVTYIDYWDVENRCVLIDGEPVLKGKDGMVPHEYGFVPYVGIDAGLGNLTADASLSQRFVGINRYLRDVLRSESRDYSIVDIIVGKNAWPAGVLTGENAKLVQKGDLDFGFGTYNPLPEGVQLQELTPKMAPDQVIQHFYATREIIDGFAMPRSLRGQSEAGVRSGADRRQILAAAQYRLRYSEMAFKHRSALVLNNCARLLKVIPGNVRVWSHSPGDEFDDIIKKDKIREPISFHVTFSPISEEDEYRKHDDYERLLAARIVTVDWVRRQMPNVDPQEMKKQDLKNQIMTMPAFAQAIEPYITAAMNKAIQGRMVAEGLTTGAPPPGPGGPQAPVTPPTPPSGPEGTMIAPSRAVPAFGSAAALQGQMRGLRSQIPMSPTQGQGGGGARGAQR